MRLRTHRYKKTANRARSVNYQFDFGGLLEEVQVILVLILLIAVFMFLN